MTRLLIVNADDFGLTSAISRGILRAHRDGIVTSVSVLAVAPAFEESVRRLRLAGDIGVGIHLAAVGEDPPLLPAGRIPSLVLEDGRFAPGWKAFVKRSRGVRPAELEAEFAAQIERARGAGLTLDHVDAHQHLHLLPRVREVVLKLAARFTIPAIRVPHAGLGRPSGPAVRWLARSLARRADRQGLWRPERSVGFEESGRMSRATLLRALEKIVLSGARCAEIFVHPGEANDPDRGRYAWGYDWAGELAALVHPAVASAVARGGFRLGTYRDLGSAAGS